MSEIKEQYDTKFNLVSESKKKLFLAWIEFLDVVQDVLTSKSYQKVLTPYLVPSGAMEAQLETFKVQKRFGSLTDHLELPTSPEFHLKKALSQGLGDIFEIKTCFRNEEHSAHHKAEFTMLEFYKCHCSLDEFMDEVLGILEEVFQTLKRQKTFKDLSFDVNASSLKELWQKKSVAALFDERGVELASESQLKDLRIAAQNLDVFFLENDSFDELYFRIWLEKIEPFLDPRHILCVHSYPQTQAALARVSVEGWAQRFEIYWKGLELGNAFEELADADVIKTRWEEENKKRQDQGKDPHPMDLQFLDSLRHLPPSCGIAIGLERFFMALLGIKDIHDFCLFN